MKLGFQDSISYRTIHVSKLLSEDKNSLWYFWDNNTKKKDLIPHNSLVFILQGIQTATIERILNSGEKEIRTKLDLYVSVENFNYRIRSGFNTWFAKCVLLSLAKMDLSELSSPIKITLRLTDDWDYNTKVCSLYNYKNDLISLAGSNWRDTDYTSLFEDLQAKIARVIGSNANNFVEDELDKVSTPVEPITAAGVVEDELDEVSIPVELITATGIEKLVVENKLDDIPF